MKPEPFPQRPSLVAHAASIIRKGVWERRWIEGLPGERQLAAQIGVSRVTLRKALEKLRSEGILEISHGKPTRPTKKALRKVSLETSSSRKVIFLSPEPIHCLPARILLTIDSLRTGLAAAGHQLEVRVFHPKAADADHAVTSLASSADDAIFLLYQQDMETHRSFHSSSLPAIVYGNQHPSFPLPAVDTDWKASTQHAANHLLRSGYPPDRIALVVPTLTLPGDRNMIAGLQEALGKDAKAFELTQNPEFIPRALDRLIAAFPPPGALIFARTRHTVAALSHFSLIRQLAIPQEMAVICLNDDPVFSFFQPAVTRYQPDIVKATQSLSALVLRAAAGGKLSKKMVRLFPDFIPGQTVERH